MADSIECVVIGAGVVGLAVARTLALAEREGVEMPIVSMVYRVLFDGLPAHRGVTELMARELRAEQDA